MSFQLAVSGITKTYGANQVLNQVGLALSAGQRVGLVGANGVGKSTLLKIVVGEVEADGGDIIQTPDMRIGYLAQTVGDFTGQTLADLIEETLAPIRQLEARLRALEKRMTAVQGAALAAAMDEYGEVLERFERGGGYEIDARTDAVLNGLGIGTIPRERLFATLSGGEKARFGLAMLLLRSPDVLLLDEPTNHLDAASLAWLEDYLQAYRGAILAVSHDRQFLNRVVNAIVEIDEHSRKTRRYAGNYDTYRQAKIQERRQWEDDYARQQSELKTLRLAVKVTARRNDNYRASIAFAGDKFLRNFKKASHERTVSRRARAAEEKLRRAEADLIPRPPEPLRFDPDFDPQALRGRVALQVSALNKTYGARRVLRDVAFALRPQSRVVLVGENGTGKSTLLKILVGEETPDSGEVYLHPAARVGYLDQEQRLLDPASTVFDAYREGIDAPDQPLKSLLLRSGLFRYEDLDKRVGQLSTGQQRKLQIARLIAGGANLLVLDEPTNYVSFDVLEEFEAALRDFPGPVIAASHDRRFLQQFDGEIWQLREGQLVVYDGGDREAPSPRETF